MTVNGTQRYAIIINGDTEPRHLKNVDRAVQALESESNFNISVVSPQKPKIAVDQHLGAYASALESLVTGLSKKMDGDDELVIYLTGHGNSGKSGEGCLALEDACYSLSELNQMLSKLPCQRRFLIADACKSGSSLSLFDDNKTTIVTLGAKGENTQCDSFSPFFWSQLGDIDSDKDGWITIQERFDYALQQNPILISAAQFYSPLKAPESRSFSGGVDNTPPFDGQPHDVNNLAEFNTARAKLKPSERALVLFTAPHRCGPCREYDSSGEFTRLAKEYGHRTLFLRAIETPDTMGEWGDYMQVVPALAYMDHEGNLYKLDQEQRKSPLAYYRDAILSNDEVRLEQYLEKAKSPDPEIRLAAIRALGNETSQRDRAASILIEAAQDPDIQIQYQALDALSDLKHPSAIPILEEIITTSTDSYAGQDAVVALIKTDRDAAKYFILNLLRDSARCHKLNRSTLAAVIEMAGKLKITESADDLVNFLGHSYSYVTAMALQSLGMIGQARHIAAMRPFLTHSDSTVGQKAIIALSALNDTASLPVIASSEQRNEALKAIGKLEGGEAYVDLVIQSLKDKKNPEIRATAAEIIAPLYLKCTPREREEINQLIVHRIKREKDPQVKAALALTAAELNLREAIPTLIEELKSEHRELRKNSAVSLGKFRAREALSTLRTLENDISYQVKQAAQEAIRTIESS